MPSPSSAGRVSPRLDRTSGRADTFFDEGSVQHLAPLGWRISDRWTIAEVEIIRFTR